jgi:hypothetical protein
MRPFPVVARGDGEGKGYGTRPFAVCGRASGISIQVTETYLRGLGEVDM